MAGNSWPPICCRKKSGGASARLKKYIWASFFTTQTQLEQLVLGLPHLAWGLKRNHDKELIKPLY